MFVSYVPCVCQIPQNQMFSCHTAGTSAKKHNLGKTYKHLYSSRRFLSWYYFCSTFLRVQFRLFLALQRQTDRQWEYSRLHPLRKIIFRHCLPHLQTLYCFILAFILLLFVPPRRLFVMFQFRTTLKKKEYQKHILYMTDLYVNGPLSILESDIPGIHKSLSILLLGETWTDLSTSQGLWNFLPNCSPISPLDWKLYVTR
jgi:hypothetical protein